MTRTRRQYGRRVLLPGSVGVLVASMLIAGDIAGAESATERAAWRDEAGPAILHASPPRAPQLENAGMWRAEPTQVCLTSAYRSGEFLYQGCLWDDQGAGVSLEWPASTMTKSYTYPTNPAYRANAADLVELRAKPHGDGTAFRITYNTMTDPGLVATTIALGDSSEPRQAPHGANTVLPAETFVTVHGTQAGVVDAVTGEAIGDVDG